MKYEIEELHNKAPYRTAKYNSRRHLEARADLVHRKWKNKCTGWARKDVDEKLKIFTTNRYRLSNDRNIFRCPFNGDIGYKCAARSMVIFLVSVVLCKFE